MGNEFALVPHWKALVKAEKMGNRNDNMYTQVGSGGDDNA